MGLDAVVADLAGGSLQRVLELARRHLGMDVAFLAEFTDGKQVYRGLDGDAASFGWVLQDGPPLSQTYCRLMTVGDLPNAIADARAHPVAGRLAVTEDADIGAYVGVPVRLADGALYGSLCTVSHSTQPVDGKDAKFLALLAELLAGDLQAQRDQDQARRRMRELIDDRRIQIALQPIADITTGQVLGVEALSRFPGDYGSPDVVFAAAQAAGLGTELETLAAATAWGVLPLLQDQHYLAINLSPAIALELAARALAAELPVHRLVLEITEHAAVESYAALRAGLAAAREQGLRVAIDDAGAGYASLHHVVELAPDIIKIDRSLINGMCQDPARRSVVRAFVTVAGDLGARIVGEGLEESADLDVARELEVHAAQGYLLARPSTEREALTRWFSSPLCTPGLPAT